MLPTMDQFTAAINKAVAEQVEWMNAEFGFSGLNIRTKIVDVPTGPLGQMRVLRKDRQVTGYQVKFQAFHFLRDEVKAFTEYASYNAWPEIGGFETKDWQLVADALVAHELAHVVQYAFRHAGTSHPFYVARAEYPRDMFFNGIGCYEGGHGYFFRQIYKRFRKQFINDRVPASAYTNPKGDFIESGHFEERMEAKTEEAHPLVGIKFQFKGKTYEVVGRNPRNARLFGYMVKTPQGGLAKIKLNLITSYSPEAAAIVAKTPALLNELVDLEAAQLVKRRANAKSSMTKRRRAASNYAMAARY